MFFSIIPGMRAARRIGAAEQKEKAGDLEGVMAVCSEALEILGAPKVDLEMPWCRSAAAMALAGYCQAARQLERRSDLLQMLTRWRPTYLLWMKEPLDDREAASFEWFEQAFSTLSSTTQA
ncbi:hypothetical protein [Corallococcus sicarius]|uniref:Uncharacterized protein n=1 Tax=Corallococcus sicarius TaxID=2316726 RepID=A0A3A8NPL6_9BACT|nr:hypothetical protein [Corallococcus sicarius]RKH44131.1 hypothetical protein D7X12_11345 [Corallococcus sicarius]